MKKMTCAGIVVAMVLYLLRLIANTSFIVPLQMRLSGFETESLYSIWKQIYHLNVYTDLHKIPFTSSTFNYVYYIIYGSVIKGVLELFALSDAWIPQIGRMVTLTVCCAGVFFSYKFFTEFVDFGRNKRFFYLGLSLFLFLGPLPGFFSLAVRPDILAVVFELIGLYSFFKWSKRHEIAAYSCLILFSYLAWAVKPTNITFFCGVSLYLLWIRNLRGFLVCASVLTLAWSATLLLGSREYVYMIIFSHLKVPFYLKGTFLHFGQALLKGLPIFLNGAVLLLILFLERNSLKSKEDFLARRDVFKLLACVATVSFCFAFITASKAGASSIYYLPASVAGAFLVMLVFNYLQSNKIKNHLIALSVISSWAILIVAMVWVLSGKHGAISKRYRDTHYQNIKNCVAVLPKPVFVWDEFASLPWINPSEPHFVIAFAYMINKHMAGEEFERGGVEGLIGEKHFPAVITFTEEQEKVLEKTYKRADNVGATDCAVLDIWLPDASA